MTKNEKTRKAKSPDAAKKRKKPEEAMHHSEERYRTILENIQEGYFEVDLAGNFTFFNDSMSRILGYFPEEMMGMNNRQFTDKENAKKLFKTFNEVYRTGESTKEFDWQIIRKDGTKRYIEVSVSLQNNSSGEPIGFRGIARDITERKQFEEALKKSEEQYRLLADNITEHVWFMDLNSMKAIYLSPSVEKMYGYTLDEMKNRSLKEIVTEESFQKIVDSFLIEKAKALATPPPYIHKFSLELEARHKDGHLLWIDNTLSFIRDENGQPVFILGETRDITERKRAEEALRESEYKYKSLIENIPDIIFTIDLEGKITFASKKTKEVLGYEEAETINMYFVNFIPEEDRQRAVESMLKGMKGEKIKHIQTPIIAKSGERLIFECSFSRIYKDGAVVGAQGTAVDITERKRAGAALQESEIKYRNLFENTGTTMLIVEEDMTISFANQGFEGLTGYTREAIEGKRKWSEFVEKSDLEKMITYHKLRRIDPTIPAKSYEFRLIHRDGYRKNILLTVDIIPGTKKSVASLLDITERKNAEEKLRENERQYRLLTEKISDIVWIADMNLRTIYISPSIKNVLGFSQEERLHQTLDQQLTPHSLSLVLEALSRELALEKQGNADPNRTLKIELEYYHKDGSTRCMELVISGLRNDQGVLTRIHGVSRDITERKWAEEQLQQTLESLRKAVGTTIQVLVSALESRDPYTAGHQSRSANLACVIATEMGLAQDIIEGIRMAGIIHDIGKLSIPAEILSKPSKLTNIEFSLIKVHSQSGYEMLKDVESPWPLAEIVYQHHERMNGSGYPRNLKGNEILIESRILAVADVVEAMASHRPYRPTLGIKAALEEIEKNKGILYDDVVADTCLKLFREKGYQLT